MRIEVKNMIRFSLRYLMVGQDHYTDEKKESYHKYIQSFQNRKISPYLLEMPSVTLEFLCFHKNWQDRACVDESLDDETLMEKFLYG